MKTLNCTQEEFQKLVDDYCSTLEETKDEMYASDRELATEFFQGFINTYWEVDIMKHQRYQAYLELKKEFDPD